MPITHISHLIHTIAMYQVSYPGYRQNPRPRLLTCSAEGGHGLQYSSLEIKCPSLGSVPQHGELSRDMVHSEGELRMLQRSSSKQSGGWVNPGGVPCSLLNI